MTNPESGDREIMDEAKRQALKEAHHDGLQIGTIVGFHDGKKRGDEISYRLLEIKGDTAVIGYRNAEDGEVRKEAPLKDLLDVGRVQDIAFQIQTRTANTLPPEML